MYETIPSTQELTRVTSLGKTRGHKKSTNDITTRGSQTIELAPNSVNILDDPLNEGATDGIAENYFSGSSIGIVHAQGTKLNQEITQGDYEILLTRKL